MNVQAWTFVLVALSFAIYIGVAIWSRARSTGEFYVAAAQVPPVLNGMATAADWMSAASFISMAGLIAFMGRDGSVYLMGWTGGYVLLALLIAPYLRKFGKYTVPDFVGDRYYSQTARIVAVVCALFVSFTYVAGQMRGVGIVFSRFLAVDINVGVWIGMTIVFSYAVLGGMKGITYTQVAQYCVLIFAYLVPAIFISILMTGTVIPQLGFGSTVADGSGVFLLDRLDGLTNELGFGVYTEGRKATLDVFFITAALMVGTAGLPHVIVRFYTVPLVRQARSSAGWALLFIALLYTTAPAVAAFARTNLLTTLSNQPYASAPEWFRNWEETGLIRFEDKNGDGLIQYTGPQSSVPNELVIDRDIMVLANPEIARLPDWVVGLVAAGGLAAALSTAAGLLLVISSSVAHDLLKKTIRPSITEKGELRAARIAAGLAVVVRRLLRRQPARLRGRSGCSGLWVGRRVVLPGHSARHLHQTHEPLRGRLWHGCRDRLHAWLHHLLQVPLPGAQQRGPLVVRRIAGRDWNSGNGHQLRRRWKHRSLQLHLLLLRCRSSLKTFGFRAGPELATSFRREGLSRLSHLVVPSSWPRCRHLFP